ncbi:hypothetical protein PQR01_11570 [Paraburkholderia rhynchosiae]|uniref:Uncharacterized protein n=1 Tax=Paraburkholderia rhynchosiae TaxID=487049 RepID=A0ACC7NE96_9BURK
MRDFETGLIQNGMAAQHLDKQILSAQRFTDPFVQGERALLDERLGRRHADPSRHLAVLAACRKPVMRYLACERIAQNGAITDRVLDDSMNALRMMPAADLGGQQFGAAVFPAFTVPYETGELILPLFKSKNEITVEPPLFGGWMKKIGKDMLGHMANSVTRQV